MTMKDTGDRAEDAASFWVRTLCEVLATNAS